MTILDGGGVQDGVFDDDDRTLEDYQSHAIKIHHVLKVGRVGREGVRIIEWAEDSVAWGLILKAWGGSVVLSITDVPEVQTLLRIIHLGTPIRNFKEAQRFWKRSRDECDLFVGTARKERSLQQIGQLIDFVRPRIAIIAVDTCYSRRMVWDSLGFTTDSQVYKYVMRNINHEQVGGAAETEAKLVYLVRNDEDWNGPYLRKAKICPQDLFTVIDDTLGGGHQPPRHAFQDSHQLGWNLGIDPFCHTYWVHAPSVYARRKVYRKDRKSVV